MPVFVQNLLCTLTWLMINAFNSFVYKGTGGLCESWKETETKLEGDVYWSLRWDSNRSEETNGGDGKARGALQRPVSFEKLRKVDFEEKEVHLEDSYCTLFSISQESLVWVL